MGNSNQDCDQMPLIFSYTRAQAIEDGVLVHISMLAGEAGIRFPIAITRGVFEFLNDTAQPGQSFEGRAWDMLMILRFEIKKASGRDAVRFSPLFNSNRHLTPKPYELSAKCHGGDNLDPVITIMFPDED